MLLVAPRAALPSISHVIPLQLVQTLKSPRWNCNVFRRSQKMTVGNYVRNLSGPGPVAAPGTAAKPSGPPLPPAPSRSVAGGGFAPCEALCRRVAGVSHPCTGVIPPDWRRRGRGSWWCGRQSADPLGENAETRLFWLNGSALWRMSCLSWCVGRTRTRYCERQPTKIPTFAHQHAKESPPDQHVSSFNPETMLIDKRHKKAAHSGRPFLLS